MASLIVLPHEWSRTMAVLQDKCDPTPYDDVAAMFFRETGHTLTDVFDDFEPDPIGVASLAQVHVGRHKASGKPVAIKVRQIQDFHVHLG